MNFYARRFNLYLLLASALLLAAGCATHKKNDKDKQLAALRVHVESSANLEDTGKTISLLRAQPVLLTISTEPVLTEANVALAQVIEARGGFAVQIHFDETGALLLEQFTGANLGKHFVIFGQWSESVTNSRWLAAPLISHRIANGTLAFTPDASREEMDQFVFGLNNVAREVRKAALK